MAALLFPSKVRDQVLEQHADLRELLREAVDELTRDAEAGSTDRARLAARGRELCARFHEHLLYEDEELMQQLPDGTDTGVL